MVTISGGTQVGVQVSSCLPSLLAQILQGFNSWIPSKQPATPDSTPYPASGGGAGRSSEKHGQKGLSLG